jgi:hypothetical protein
MNAYRLLVRTTPGPTRRDVPGYCGVVEKAERGTDALRRILGGYCLSYFGAVFVRLFVRPGVACTFMHFTSD